MAQLPPALASELVGSAWSSDPPRAKALPLRAGAAPKTLNPIREAGRRRGAEDLRQAVALCPKLTMQDVADALGLKFDKQADELASGKIPMTWGEFVDRAPLPVLVRAIALALPRRIARERAEGFDTSALEIVRHCAETLSALLKP